VGRGAVVSFDWKEGYLMDWAEPKVDWINADVVTAFDFDRIERNVKYLQELLG
jgi:hypothetical protein